MGMWQICLLGIILNAASAIFYLFEEFFDLWIWFMFTHWNVRFLNLSERNWLKPMGVWQICLLGIILDAVSAIFHLFDAFFDLRLCLRIEVSDF